MGKHLFISLSVNHSTPRNKPFKHSALHLKTASVSDCQNIVAVTNNGNFHVVDCHLLEDHSGNTRFHNLWQSFRGSSDIVTLRSLSLIFMHLSYCSCICILGTMCWQMWCISDLYWGWYDNNQLKCWLSLHLSVPPDVKQSIHLPAPVSLSFLIPWYCKLSAAWVIFQGFTAVHKPVIPLKPLRLALFATHCQKYLLCFH